MAPTLSQRPTHKEDFDGVDEVDSATDRDRARSSASSRPNTMTRRARCLQGRTSGNEDSIQPDVLSEGLNLQDGDSGDYYDLHWNPCSIDATDRSAVDVD